MTSAVLAVSIIGTVFVCCSRDRRAPDNEHLRLLVSNLAVEDEKANSPYSSSILDLIDAGEPALHAVVPILLSEDPAMRRRAQRVVEGVVMRLYGFEFGRGWKTSDGEKDFSALYKSLGNYHWDAPVNQRAFSVMQWKTWLLKQKLSRRWQKGMSELRDNK